MLIYEGRPKLIVDGVPGMYMYYPESGSGKTYLFHEARNRQISGENIVTYTKWDYDSKVDIKSYFSEGKFPELVVVDRADNFCRDKNLMHFLNQISEHSIVLLDIKHMYALPVFCRFCDIYYDTDVLKVVCDLPG